MVGHGLEPRAEVGCTAFRGDYGCNGWCGLQVASGMGQREGSADTLTGATCGGALHRDENLTDATSFFQPRQKLVGIRW